MGQLAQWHFNRRRFLSASASLGAGSLLHVPPAHAEPPPETKTIRLAATPAICLAPQYIAAPLLETEGFTDVQYVGLKDTGAGTRFAASGVDMTMDAVGPFLTRLDAGDPIVNLAGVHLGCYELFDSERVKGIRDLKRKRVPIDGFGGSQHVFLSSMIAYVGLDPRKDIQWREGPSEESMRLFAEGKLDAYLGFPPEPQELRAKNVGHVVVNTAVDKPWANYFCCMIIAHRDYVRKYPVATKRAVRAMLKATDQCVQDPKRAARIMVDKGFAANYEYARETLNEVQYREWRNFDPEDTIRFHALRLHEVGMIKTPPNKLIELGTDWRFLNELKKELKV
jgi:NitT/TauT family transport system substrate-binding protein